MEPVEVVLVGVLVIPVKTDGATVLLLVDPNMEDVMLEEGVEAGWLVVVRLGGCPKAAPVVVPPKMGLKFWTEGLLSEVGVEEVVVMVTAKMGLNPEASSGLLLQTEPEVLAGGVADVTELEEAAGALIWLASPNREGPAAGAAELLLEVLET